MTILTIKVTKDILEKSKGCGIMGGDNSSLSTNCAVALAIRDIFPFATVSSKFIAPFGGGKYTSIMSDEFFLTIPLPPSARTFIRKFDALYSWERVAMDEIQFDIEIPDDVIEQINIDEIKSLLINHPTLILS